MRFSERHGHKPVRQAIQIDSMSPELRNSLWNVLSALLWEKVYSMDWPNYDFFRLDPEMRDLALRIWGHYWKIPTETLTDHWPETIERIRKYFFACKWYEVYDFIEFVAQHYPANHAGFHFGDPARFLQVCNAVLEQEGSAYRFVGTTVSPISNEQEICEVEEAIGSGRGAYRTHLDRALQLLSDREHPDYRNSIKESISAVESVVSLVLGQKGTLGQLLRKLEKDAGLHGALLTAFSNLYGYTSDESGIRHALLEESNVGFAEAKFFMVTCSAFINFVQMKFPGAI